MTKRFDNTDRQHVVEEIKNKFGASGILMGTPNILCLHTPET